MPRISGCRTIKEIYLIGMGFVLYLEYCDTFRE